MTALGHVWLALKCLGSVDTSEVPYQKVFNVADDQNIAVVFTSVLEQLKKVGYIVITLSTLRIILTLQYSQS